MKKQEILMSLILAYEEQRWDRVRTVLEKEGMLGAIKEKIVPIEVGQVVSAIPSSPVAVLPEPSSSAKATSDNPFRVNHQAFSPKPKNGPVTAHVFTNRFVDDGTEESAEIEESRKLSEKAKPKSHRPPPPKSLVTIPCSRCGTPTIVDTLELESGSSFSCSKCLKKLKGSR